MPAYTMNYPRHRTTMDGITRDEKEEELRPINLPSPSGVADFPHDVEQPSSPSKDTRHESDAIPLSFSCIMIALVALTSIVWVGMLAGELIGNHFYPEISIRPPEKDEDALVSLLSNSTFTNDTVANLVAPLLVNDNTGDSVGNAIQALQYFKTDGEPVQVNGHPFLFVGSVGASLNKKSLDKDRITHIVNFSRTARCNMHSNIEYLCFQDTRGGREMTKHVDLLDQAVEFIESARKSGGRAMSHCWHGMNRSVTVLVAYLMKYESMTAEEANDLIKQTRPQADPYWEALTKYSEDYLSGGGGKGEQEENT